METEGLKIDNRRKQILELLAEAGLVRVSLLSRKLGVTEVTIRNDLAALEREGLLDRVSGGAVLTVQSHNRLDFQSRKLERAAEKKAIAAAAASLVQDGDTLLINAGTTTALTAEELKQRKNLNIVTNSLLVATELGGVPTFRVILLGGEINTQYFFTYGNEALKQLGNYKADKGILSVDGVMATAGLTTYHPEETELNRMMIEQSHSTIIVADYTKLGRAGFSYIEKLSRADICVTNKSADPTALAEISDQGVKVIAC